MTRQRVSLKPPPEDHRELRRFPRCTLRTETDLWRFAARGRGPWWFGSSMSGRFDLAAPEGTCYLATDALSALLEVIGPDRLEGRITAEELDRRSLYRLRVPTEHALADLTSRRAAGSGVTLEVHSLGRYDLTQAWALSLRASGAGGLLYFARHDPSGGDKGHSVALFGPAGERDWNPGEQAAQPELISRLRRECGIEVVERPRTRQLTLIE